MAEKKTTKTKKEAVLEGENAALEAAADELLAAAEMSEPEKKPAKKKTAKPKKAPEEEPLPEDMIEPFTLIELPPEGA